MDRSTLNAIIRDRNNVLFRKHLKIDPADGGGIKYLEQSMDDWQREDFLQTDPGWQSICGQPVPGAKMRAYLERGRGHAKSFQAAVSAANALFTSTRPISGIVASGDRDQAKIVRDQMSKLVMINDHLRVLDVQNFRAVNTETGSELQICSGDVATSWGHLIDFAILDELSVWPLGSGEELWTSLFSAVAKKQNAMLLIISNAGTDRDSWQYAIRQAASEDPGWYFHSLQGPQASWISEKVLAEQQRLLPPTAYKRLWLNEWGDGEGDFLSREDVEASLVLAGPERTRDPHATYVCGVDLSVRRDHTGVCVLKCDHATRKLHLVDVRAWVPKNGQDVDLREVRQTVKVLNDRFHFALIYADPSQLELMKQDWRSDGISAVTIPFTGPNTTAMAMDLLAVFRDRRIFLYNDPELVKDLYRLEIRETNWGFKLFSARDPVTGSHSDRGVALALAVMAGLEVSKGVGGKPPTGVPTPLKPRPSIRFDANGSSSARRFQHLPANWDRQGPRYRGDAS